MGSKPNTEFTYGIAPTRVAVETQKAIDEGYRVIVHQGGTRSGKTYSIQDLLIGLAYRTNLKISVCSISLPHLKKGAMRDWRELMEAKGDYHPNHHNMTDLLYQYPLGSYIEFFSVDDAKRVRGPGRDVLHINEANLLSLETYRQLSIRTRQIVIMDYNPADEYHWIYDEVIPRKDCKFIQTTYLDNPFLSKEQRTEIEHLKDIDPNFWRVYGLGERGQAQATIYSNWELYEREPEKDYCFGLDFGFNHPNALVKVCHDDGRIYLKQEFFKSHVTTPELIQAIKPIVRQKYVYCDHSRPEIINELRRAGINAYEANKAVKEGIDWLRSNRVYIHKESVDLQKEFRQYKWKTKPSGEILDEPVKMFDDLCFVGSTFIKTISGYKQIKDIDSSDFVYTSDGYKPVLNLFNNGTKQVTKHSMHFDMFSLSLSCTDNHLIKTDKAWTEILKLESGMTVYLTRHLMEENINFTQIGVILHSIATICIGLFGSFTMANAIKAFIFIMLMVILGIISLIICSLLKVKNIVVNTLKNVFKIKSLLIYSMPKESKPLNNGISQKMESPGIKNMQIKWDLVGNGNILTLASNVVRFILIQLQALVVNSATQTVKLRHLERGVSWKEQVYDIEVENRHEYFANGLLVHNCDAARYGAISFKNKAQPMLSFHR